MTALTEQQWAVFRLIVLEPLESFRKQTRLSPYSKTYKATLSKLTLQSERQLSNTTTPNEYNGSLRTIIQYLEEIPPDLRPSVHRHVALYCHRLDPFLFNTHWAANQSQCTEVLKTEVEDLYLYRIPKLWSPTSQLARRHRAGLLREEQVQLLVTAERAFADELGAIIDTKVDAGTDSTLRSLTKVYICVTRYWLLLSKFLLSEQFRSEALESKLLKYLGEEEVNEELLEKLDRANWEFQVNRPLLKGMLPSK
ncbi:hypothetical protein BJ508DRAFT_362467 [Ascobolus immersus RN42]|uniref:Uncharacterized protein n=1 Tax=Ascobolus immersus RN42 TaxID=1160509 RepID=A0A3N4I3N1_ASCIM|nr:hypothetical protein BJ508DRAFT_362467 [Ascobolus immersus RN42]